METSIQFAFVRQSFAYMLRNNQCILNYDSYIFHKVMNQNSYIKGNLKHNTQFFLFLLMEDRKHIFSVLIRTFSATPFQSIFLGQPCSAQSK